MVKNKKVFHALFALSLALVVGVSAGAVYFFRDSFFEWQWRKPAGVFTEQEDPKLRQAALEFVQKKITEPGEVCVDQWVGKDERFIYMAVGCALFAEKLGQVEAKGDQNFIATRFRYDGEEIETIEQIGNGDFKNAIRRLYPKAAAYLLMVRMNEDVYRRLGMEKSLN